MRPPSVCPPLPPGTTNVHEVSGLCSRGAGPPTPNNLPPFPVTHDPFAILGLEPTFDLPAHVVERAYLVRAGATHPDAAGPGPDAADGAALLNRAKDTLLHSESRAGAMLSRLGGPSKEQDKSLPPGFLMEFMETRAEVDAALTGHDEAARWRWRAWALRRRADYERVVGQAFLSVGTPPAPSLLAVIRRELNAWRYIERLIEQIDPPGAP